MLLFDSAITTHNPFSHITKTFNSRDHREHKVVRKLELKVALDEAYENAQKLRNYLKNTVVPFAENKNSKFIGTRLKYILDYSANILHIIFHGLKESINTKDDLLKQRENVEHALYTLIQLSGVINLTFYDLDLLSSGNREEKDNIRLMLERIYILISDVIRCVLMVAAFSGACLSVGIEDICDHISGEWQTALNRQENMDKTKTSFKSRVYKR